MFGIPANRIVAFAGPYMSAAAGGIASWLVARVNIAGVPGLDQNNVKTGIAAAFTWLLVSALTWAGHSKWLTGHQIQMEADARISAAVVSQPAVAPASVEPVAAVAPAAAVAPVAAFAPPTADVIDVDLPSDEEEFAAPPSPVPFTTAAPGMA
jgi:hypothetical protein